jgi:hypothetical protein
LFKEFAVLRERFHHNIDKHGRVFRAIAVIVQISLKYETPVMQVHYPAPGNFY